MQLVVTGSLRAAGVTQHGGRVSPAWLGDTGGPECSLVVPGGFVEGQSSPTSYSRAPTVTTRPRRCSSRKRTPGWLSITALERPCRSLGLPPGHISHTGRPAVRLLQGHVEHLALPPPLSKWPRPSGSPTRGCLFLQAPLHSAQPTAQASALQGTFPCAHGAASCARSRPCSG